MYADTVAVMAELGQRKAKLMKRSPAAFFVGTLLAGAYVGIGILLIFSVGSRIDPAWQPLVMGASFGIALTLVLIAGAELFTGHTMYMTFGWLARKTSVSDLGASWSISWIGNFLGSLGLAAMFVLGGGGVILEDGASLIFDVSAKKMNDPASALFFRGILCNWLVCLALWMSFRLKNEMAKVSVIFWCLFTFIAAGFEHSVANMTVLSIALLGDHPDTITWAGMGRNLWWVSLGNIVGGALFLSIAYWVASPAARPRKKQTVRTRASRRSVL